MVVEVTETTSIAPTMVDRIRIRELIDQWVVARDSADWSQFRRVWHEDGRMMATWFQGTADEFIAVSKAGLDNGVNILHFLGGSSIRVAGDRAVAQTKMMISQRAEVEGVPCDVSCTGRFYDLFERRDDRWGMVLRQPIYEKDRLDPIEPGVVPKLDPQILSVYPVGYQHLAYLQHNIGYEVKKDMPGLTGPDLEALYALGEGWLNGAPANWGTAHRGAL
jgi:SnoaL-like domain